MISSASDRSLAGESTLGQISFSKMVSFRCGLLPVAPAICPFSSSEVSSGERTRLGESGELTFLGGSHAASVFSFSRQSAPVHGRWRGR